MSKLTGMAVAAALCASVPAGAAVIGPDASLCRDAAGGPALIVKVDGFKARTGDLRVQIYGSEPKDFLAKGKKLKRIDLGVTRSGAMEVCVGLPAPGRYAVAVRHDVDGSGKSGWNDGGGFSRNPSLSLFNLKPRYEDVVITVGSRVQPVNVVLNYRRGLSIGPVADQES